MREILTKKTIILSNDFYTTSILPQKLSSKFVELIPALKKILNVYIIYRVTLKYILNLIEVRQKNSFIDINNTLLKGSKLL